MKTKTILLIGAALSAAALVWDFYQYTEAKKNNLNKLGVFSYDPTTGATTYFKFK